MVHNLLPRAAVRRVWGDNSDSQLFFQFLWARVLPQGLLACGRGQRMEDQRPQIPAFESLKGQKSSQNPCPEFSTSASGAMRLREVNCGQEKTPGESHICPNVGHMGMEFGAQLLEREQDVGPR